MGWAQHAACTGEMTNAYKILIGKTEGRRLLGRPRHKWEENIKMCIINYPTI
jgi:hypothetical protein